MGGKNALYAHFSFRADNFLKISTLVRIWPGWPQQNKGNRVVTKTLLAFIHYDPHRRSRQAFLKLCNGPNDCCMSDPMYQLAPHQRITMTSGFFGSCYGFTFNALKWPTSWSLVCQGVERCSDSRIYMNTRNTFASGYFPRVPANTERKFQTWEMTLTFPWLALELYYG